MSGGRTKLFEFFKELIGPSKPKEEVLEPLSIPLEESTKLQTKLPPDYLALDPRSKIVTQLTSDYLAPNLLETWRLNGTPIYDETGMIPIGYEYKGILANTQPTFNFKHKDKPQILGNTGIVSRYTTKAGIGPAWKPIGQESHWLEFKPFKKYSDLIDKKSNVEKKPYLYLLDELTEQEVNTDLPRFIDSLGRRSLIGGAEFTHFISEGSEYLKKKYGLRQAVLNDPKNLTFIDNALNTLAEITNLPKEAIGLEELTIIPDIRGLNLYGNLADFHPDTRVIRHLSDVNSLAHEWAHAFDNYIFNKYVDILSSKYNKQFVTHVSKGTFKESMRTELSEVITDIHQILNDPNTHYFRDSALADGGIELPDGSWNIESRYYTHPTEMFARAFDYWTYSKIGSVPGLNKDILDYGPYPLPMDKEKEKIFAVFDDLFNKIKARKVYDEEGNFKWELYTIAPITIGATLAATSDEAEASTTQQSFSVSQGWMPQKTKQQSIQPMISVSQGWMPSRTQTSQRGQWMRKPGEYFNREDYLEELSQMVRRTPKEAINLIMNHEGFRSHIYKDAVGKDTIGYGHLIKPGENFDKALTKEEAISLLGEDLADAENAVEKYVTVPLTDKQFGALVSFVFNVGPVAFRESTLLKLLNQGDYDGAANQFIRWDKGGGKTLAGLTKRRKDERSFFLG